MFRSAKPQRPQLGPEQPTNPESTGTAKAIGPESGAPNPPSPDPPHGQQLLDSLRGQPGFGVDVTASEVEPSSTPQNLGQRLDVELDAAISRERHVLELIDLASKPARNLTSEQLRRLLELMG